MTSLVSVASHICPILVKIFNRKITRKMYCNYSNFFSPYGIKKCVWECWCHNSKFLLSCLLPDEIHIQKALKYKITIKTAIVKATCFIIRLLTIKQCVILLSPAVLRAERNTGNVTASQN